MSVLGVSAVALAAVYVVIGVHALFLWSGQRSELYYALFGGVCLCMGVYAAAAAVIVQTADLGEVAGAQDMQLAMAAAATGFYVHFAHRLAGRPGRVLPISMHAVSVLAIVAGATGNLSAGARAMDPLVWSVIDAPNQISAVPTVWAQLLEVVMLLQVLVAGYYHYAPTFRHDTFRLPAYAPLIMVGSGVWDVYIQYARIGLPFLSEYAFGVLSFVVTARFLAQGAAVSRELSAHAEAIEQGTRRLEQTKQELVRREQLAAVGELSAIVAHELRNPLAVLHNTVAGLAKPDLSEHDYQMLVDVMDEETDRLELLVSDLLTYVKPLELERREVSLAQIVDTALERAVTEAGTNRAVEVSRDIAPAAERCFVDAELLRQALGNLLDNALHAGADRIAVRAGVAPERGGKVLTLSVHDSGKGMSAEVAERASEPFFTTRAAGTGLGLAIVERVVRAHGGQVGIDSAADRGTTVSLRLPLSAEDALRTTAATRASDASLVGFELV